MTMAPYLAADSIRYRRGGRWILRSAYVDAIPGTITALIGVSGAGKTTLLEVLVGSRRPATGVIRWAGTAISRPGPRQRADCAISFLPAVSWLPPQRSAGELLRLTARVWRSDWQAVAAELDLTGWIERRVSSLSGGERRLLGLAVVLSCDSRAMVLDEPFRGLDPIHRERVAGLLRHRAARGVAILFADHDRAMILMADRVFSINNGATRSVPDFKVRPMAEWYQTWR